MRSAALRITEFVLSDFGQAIFRMCVAESDRFPDLGREFFRTGPQIFRDQLAGYVQHAANRGELAVDDVTLAADQFIELCHATLFVERVFGLRDTYTQDELDRVVDGAVEMFMARYGA